MSFDLSRSRSRPRHPPAAFSFRRRPESDPPRRAAPTEGGGERTRREAWLDRRARTGWPRRSATAVGHVRLQIRFRSRFIVLKSVSRLEKVPRKDLRPRSARRRSGRRPVTSSGQCPEVRYLRAPPPSPRLVAWVEVVSPAGRRARRRDGRPASAARRPPTSVSGFDIRRGSSFARGSRPSGSRSVALRRPTRGRRFGGRTVVRTLGRDPSRSRFDSSDHPTCRRRRLRRRVVRDSVA